MSRSFLLTILFLASTGVTGESPSSPIEIRTASVTNSNTEVIRETKVHTVGGVRVNVGNEGTFASMNSRASQEDGIRILYGGYPSFEFPAGSSGQHSFTAGLWISALRGTGTLVSRATGLWSDSRLDFNSFSPIHIMQDTLRGHQRFESVYYDTVRSTLYGSRIEDPIGLEIRQVSHAFASPPYDQFIIIEYLIRNISDSTIRQARVGFFNDCDVYNDKVSGQPEGRADDDVSGYLHGEGIAYSLDNNGDPRGDTAWNHASIVSAMGIALIASDPLPSCTSFNWFATNYANAEWGPSRPHSGYSNMRNPVSAGEVHEMMGNGEIDYDQLFTLGDKTSEGWNPPPPLPVATDIANGLDTRYVISYAYGELAPQDSVRIVIAVAGGDSVHHFPDDFKNHFIPAQPQNFYNTLNFSDLIRNVTLAKNAWDHSFDLYGAAPSALSLTPVADDAIRCSWTPAPFRQATGYRALRRQDGVMLWDTVAYLSSETIQFVDTSLIPGTTYEYAVASLDSEGVVGPHSQPKRIRASVPPDIPALSVSTTPAKVILECKIPIPFSGFSDYDYLNIYRSVASTTVESLYMRVPLSLPNPTTRKAIPADSRRASAPERRYGYFIPPIESFSEGDTIALEFIDEDVQSGVKHSYRASITNAVGFESPLTAVQSVIPMQFGRRGLILFGGTPYYPLVNRDSVKEFYASWAATFDFDTAEARLPQSPFRDSLLSMRHLSLYKSLIIIAEDQIGGIPLMIGANELESYAHQGGKCVFVLRNHGATEIGRDSPYPYIRHLGGVTSVLRESLILHGRSRVRVEFIGAQSVNAEYPSIEADSARGWDDEYLQETARQATDLFADGFTPVVGAIAAFDDATEVLYTYKSADTNSAFGGMPVAVRRLTDSTSAILFNFPLSLMNHKQAWQALTQAVYDLGIDTTRYLEPVQSTSRNIIDWLYGKSTGEPDPKWDIDRDGLIDIRDVVEELNR